MASVAFAGAVDVPQWLGSAATHSMSGFGGGALVAGRSVDIADSRVVPEREGEVPAPGFRRSGSQVRVVIGPRHRHVDPAAVETLTSGPYRPTDASDRTGVRLDGPPRGRRCPADLVRTDRARSVQVTGDGVPAVLLAARRTAGGAPKIATVITPDLDGFARRRTGDEVRFEAVDPGVAVDVARRAAGLVRDDLTTMAGEGRTLAHRLREQNLIGGAIHLPAEPSPRRHGDVTVTSRRRGNAAAAGQRPGGVARSRR